MGVAGNEEDHSEIRKQPGPLVPGGELDGAAADLVRNLLGAPSQQAGSIITDLVGGLLGDRFREWRTRRFIDGLQRTAAFIQKKGIPLDRVKALPNGELYAIFENMSKQDDPRLADMWAGLLANVASTLSTVEAEPILLASLKALGSAEALVIEYVWKFETEAKRISALPLPEVDYNLAEQDKEKYHDQIHKLQAEHEQRRIDMAQALAPIKDKIDAFETEKINRAVGNLTSLRLISTPRGDIWQSDIIENTYDYHLGSRVTELRPDRLIRVLKEIDTAIDGLTGEHVNTGKSMLYDIHNFSAPGVKLTELGQRLMEACH
jgi:hypothetical protein